MFCWSPSKIKSSTYEQIIFSKQIENIHGNWLFLLGSKNTHFLIHPNNFTYVFVNIRSMPKWVQMCRMQLRPSDIVVSPHILRLVWWFPYWIRLKICKIWPNMITFVINFAGMRFLLQLEIGRASKNKLSQKYSLSSSHKLPSVVIRKIVSDLSPKTH